MGIDMAKQNKLTNEQIEAHKKQIDAMDVVQLAKFRRYAPAGHVYFDRTTPLYLYFENRFQSLGGMTPELSKQIGWREEGTSRT